MLSHCSHREDDEDGEDNEDDEDGEDDGMMKMMFTLLFACSFRLGKALSD